MFKQIVSVFCAYALLAAQAAPAWAQLTKTGGQALKTASESGVKAAQKAGVTGRTIRGVPSSVASGSAASGVLHVGSSASTVRVPSSVPTPQQLSSLAERVEQLAAVRAWSITPEEIHSFVAQGDLSTPLNYILSVGITDEHTFVLGNYLKGYAAPDKLKGAREAISAMMSSKMAWSEGVVRTALALDSSRAAALQELFTRPNALADATIRMKMAAEVRDALVRLLKDSPASKQEEILNNLAEDFTKKTVSPDKTVEELKAEGRWAVIVLWAIVGAASGMAVLSALND